MRLKEMIAVMQHFEDGGKIEVYYDNEWDYTDCPQWDWYRLDYRIKVEPIVVYIDKSLNVVSDKLADRIKLKDGKTRKFIEVVDEKT